MFGVKEFAAIINPPQSSILAIGASEERVLAVQGAPTIATMMSATLSCDHRVIDGALGAKLLSSLKALLESPMNLLV
jgi:pyruvate dehydrogenase E2 component (dihydrolipoamide acetyltransferase)